MTQKGFEIFYYIGSSQPVADWLKSEGVKTKKQAIKKLEKFLSKNPIEMDIMVKKLSVVDVKIVNGNIVDGKIVDKYSGGFFRKVLENFK